MKLTKNKLKEIIRKEIQKLNEVRFEEELDLDKIIGDKRLNRTLRNKKWDGKVIKYAQFDAVQAKDVCSPMIIDFKDGSRDKYYGYDALEILDKFKLKYK